MHRFLITMLITITILLPQVAVAGPLAQLPAAIDPPRATSKLYVLKDPNGNLSGASEHMITLSEILQEAIADDVGLGNVDNTSDAAKPVSTATQTALNLKAPLASPVFTTDITVNGLTFGRGGGGLIGNMAAGDLALNSNTTGTSNAATGYRALYSNTTGNSNTAHGLWALYSNTAGSYNTAVGWALYDNTTGGFNTAVGSDVLTDNTSGGHNTGTGYRALSVNTTGSYNTAIGDSAGRFLANGSSWNTTGSNSVFLGNDTRAQADGQTNQIVIGSGTIGNGSNSVTLGNDSITITVLKGTVTAPAWKGTVTNDNAPAGAIGEYVSAALASGSATSLTTATSADVTSISLTAGDWDVTGATNYILTGATATKFQAGVSTTSATLGGENTYLSKPVSYTGLSDTYSDTLPTVRLSLAATTTVYLVANGTFTAGTVSAYGNIRARRVR